MDTSSLANKLTREQFKKSMQKQLINIHLESILSNNLTPLTQFPTSTYELDRFYALYKVLKKDKI